MNQLVESGPISNAGPQQTETPSPSRALSTLRTSGLHWPEYLMEAGELGVYVFFACVFATVLQHPASSVRHLISGSLARRALYGFAMGCTVVGTVMTPWGKQSGGHFNPAITFTFYRLGKVELWDGLFYAVAQFSGATCGVAIAAYVLRGALANSAVRYAVTVPGEYGSSGAFTGELTISFALMSTILFVTNAAKLARYTPYFVGALYAIFVRNTTIRNEYEPRANVWFSISRHLLACDLDLFRSTNSGHALRGRGFSATSRWCPSVLCQAPPCQQQTLHLPPPATVDKESFIVKRQNQRGKCYRGYGPVRGFLKLKLEGELNRA